MSKSIISTAAIAGLLIGFASLTPIHAAGQHNGWGDETTTQVIITEEETQGRSGKPAKDNGNQGTATDTTTTTTTTTSTGPRGQLNKEGTHQNETSTSTTDTSTAETDKPGRN